MSEDPYAVLGVDADSSAMQIRAAYRNAVRRVHPDQANGQSRDHAEFTSIVDAWALLGDPAARAEFDRSRRDREPGSVAASDGESATPSDERSTRQIRRAFVVALVIVVSVTFVLFVVGMSQSGGR